MTRQLAYSGLLELAQMRKQHLSERRNLRGFCGYFSSCSRDPESLRMQPLATQARSRPIVPHVCPPLRSARACDYVTT